MAEQKSRISLEELPELEVQCQSCSGDGTIDIEGGRWRVCPECRGQRVVPTEFGKEVLGFLSRHVDEIGVV